MGRGLEKRPTTKSSTISNTTANLGEDNSVRCGKWILRSTPIRRARGQQPSPQFEPSTPTSKRKRLAPSPTPSVNSCIGENSVQLPIMAARKGPVDMWSFANTEIFLQIMVDVHRKTAGTNSKKTRKFNSLEWDEILQELSSETNMNCYSTVKIQQKFDRLKKDFKLFQSIINNTGLGWDPVAQTVTAPPEVWQTFCQANANAEKFKDKGLDHYDLLEELLEGSQATGLFGRPSTLGSLTLEEEQEMRYQAKHIRKGDNMSVDSSKKRMSDGEGGSSSKSTKVDPRVAYDKLAYTNEKRGEYHKLAYANEKRGEYFETKTQQLRGEMSNSIEAYLAVLNTLKEHVHPNAYYTALEIMVEKPSWRQTFMALTHEDRIVWINRLGRNN